MAAFLGVLPFFAILLYFKNFYEVIVFHAVFLFLLLLIREVIKDLENLKGDFANNYKTIPIIYGEIKAKKTITILCLMTVFPVYFLIEVFDVGYMDVYFYLSFLILLFFLIILWKSSEKTDYFKLHNLLKFLIIAGIFCIVLINPSVLINGRNYLKI